MISEKPTGAGVKDSSEAVATDTEPLSFDVLIAVCASVLEEREATKAGREPASSRRATRSAVSASVS